MILPGYGPNTRTIMQVKVAGSARGPGLQPDRAPATPSSHQADGTGVFESGQHPIIVGQAAYNSAYGTTFAASGNCTAPTAPTSATGSSAINQQGGHLRVRHPQGPNAKMKIAQPKAIHDEMNSAAFDEFGRMTANLGLEAVPADAGRAEHHALPVHRPGDRGHRRHEPAEEDVAYDVNGP